MLLKAKSGKAMLFHQSIFLIRYSFWQHLKIENVYASLGGRIDEYLALVIIVSAAFVIPLISIKIKIPVVVGEIIFGIILGIIGTVFANFTGSNPFIITEPLEFLSLLGFIFLMFMVGLEVDVDALVKSGIKMIASSTAGFIATLALSFSFSLFIAQYFLESYESAFFLALLLSISSVDIAMLTLRETGYIKKPMGQSILISAMIADVGAMVLIALFAATGSGRSAGSGYFAFEILSLVGVFVLIYLIYKLGAEALWLFPTVFKKFFRSDDHSEMGMRFSLAIIFIFLAVAEMGREPLAVLGVFLAGISISALFREGASLTNKLSGIAFGFLVPIFFIKVGMDLDFSSILTIKILFLVPVLILITIIVKMLPPFFEFNDFRNTVKEKLSKGLILSARLSLLIAASEIGKTLGVISSRTQVALIVLAVISSTTVPMVFKHIWGEANA